MPREADCYLMSLIENLARRHRSSIDLINAIVSLKERGYSAEQIAEKTNLGRTYVTGVVTLMRDGEERLVNAVDKGHIPLAVAIDIARSDDGQVQALLAEAYESGALRGDRLNIARKVVTRRKTFGKRFHGVIRRRDRPGSAQALIKAYEDEVRRQKLMIKKAELNEQRLLFIVSALKTLLQDENFLTLLRAEQLDTLPKFLAEQIKQRAADERPRCAPPSSRDPGAAAGADPRHPPGHPADPRPANTAPSAARSRRWASSSRSSCTRRRAAATCSSTATCASTC